MKNMDLKAFLQDLTYLCALDSGQSNGPGAEAVADFFESRYKALGLSVERRHMDGNEHAPFLLVSNSIGKAYDALFIAHMDTVFPVGTGAKRPVTLEDGIIRGPGVADCKGGCLLVYYLIKSLLDAGKCNFTFRIAMNSDEETRSEYSREYFEELAPDAKYCFVFEPGRANDEFVAERKGSVNYHIKCHGIAAHAGNEPEKGASAILELARWTDWLMLMEERFPGTTMNVGVFHGGVSTGIVPPEAELRFSMRYRTEEALDALVSMMGELKREPFDARTSVELFQLGWRPAMPLHENTLALLKQLEQAGQDVGQDIAWLSVGGGSDGNFVAPFGVATLDGCGPCGGNLHTENEYIKAASVEQRLILMTRLLEILFP